MRIADIRLDRLIGDFDAPADFQAERLSRPIDMYPEHDAERAGTWARRIGDSNRHRIDHVYLTIQTDEGVYGLAGPRERYEFAAVIGRQLRRLLIGENPDLGLSPPQRGALQIRLNAKL
jgi:hypothetical protein